MNPRAQNTRREFGKAVGNWQWVWCDQRMVLQNRRTHATVDIQDSKNGIWFWRFGNGLHHKSENFFVALEEALLRLNLPKPVKVDLKMIAATEYKRLCSLDEEFNKLKERGSHADVHD